MSEHPKPALPPAPMATSLWEGELPGLVQGVFAGQLLESLSYLGQNFFVVDPPALIPLIEYLKLRVGFDYLVDITAVDHPKREKRFELIYILFSYSRNERIRIKASLADGEHAATATDLFLGANWLEREVYDMFGIHFAGHPDLKRILLPEEWTGFPLRKEYGITQMDNHWVQENLGIESGQ